MKKVMRYIPAFAFMVMFSGAALAAQDSLEFRLQFLAEQNRELQDQLQAQKNFWRLSHWNCAGGNR